MKAKSIFFVNSTHKTKTWWMFLSVLVLVFVPFLITWILCCEFNVLNCDWLIAKNASVWHGVVVQDNIPHLVERYGKYFSGDLASELSKYVGSSNQYSIDSYKCFFNPVVLAPLLGLLVWSIVYPMIFNATKLSGLDVLPFSAAIGSTMLVLIISGLMDHWSQNIMGVYWLVRVLIACVATFIVFIISNYFVNKYLASRPYATDLYFGYKSLDKQTEVERQQLKENVDIFKQHKDQDPSYVEIEEGK